MNDVYIAIEELIDYGIQKHLLEHQDIVYAKNQILNLLQLDQFPTGITASYDRQKTIDDIVKPLLDYAHSVSLIEPNTITRRDMFEAKLINALCPRPSTLQATFERLNQNDSKLATDHFYQFSKHTNYIKMSRVNQNILWKSPTKYGVLDMTINVSKPEKDPRDIIAASSSMKREYPKCLLCVENVGYNGATTSIGRSSHRTIKLSLNNEPFHLQYSPYVYYNEHCIVLHEEHIPMNVTIATFQRLFDFVDQFPHYFLGSNAGLPIVGGSILSHEHYQGGAHHFPIEDAEVLYQNQIDDVTLEIIKWPLSVVRLSSNNRSSLIETAQKLYAFWETYDDETAGIVSSTNTPHNAITPIARKKGTTYQLDIALRNNITSNEFPLGVFHPHPEHHHIKKENIGLIEVMGLAVLPARLKVELQEIITALQQQQESLNNSIHDHWYQELKKESSGKDLEQFVYDQTAIKFMKCIENAGVFKQDGNGPKQFQRFVDLFIESL